MKDCFIDIMPFIDWLSEKASDFCFKIEETIEIWFK